MSSKNNPYKLEGDENINFVDIIGTKKVSESEHKKITPFLLVSLLLIIGLTVGLYEFISRRSFEPKPTEVHAAYEHPHLLFTSGEIASINSRISNGGMVQAVFNQMKYDPFDYNSTQSWRQEITDNAFHAVVSGDTGSRAWAMELWNKYANPYSTYYLDFKEDNAGSTGTLQDDGERNYGHASECSSLVLAYDFLYPYLSSTQRDQGKTLLLDWATGTYNHYKNVGWYASGNFHTGMFGCLGMIGIVLKGEHTDSVLNTWINFAKYNLVTNYYNISYNPGGDFEDSNLYQYYGSGPAVVFAMAYEKETGEDIISNTYAANTWDYYTYVWMSDGKYAQYGDNSIDKVLNGENFYFLKKKREAGDQRIAQYLWLWEQVRGPNGERTDYSTMWKAYDRFSVVLYYPQGITPASPNNHPSFPTTKLFVSKTTGTTQGPTDNPGGNVSMRTGWGSSNDITLFMLNRWKWIGHQHYDPNNILLSAYGKTLLSSLNYWNYNDPLRGKISQKNTILINKDNWNGDCPVGDYSTGLSASLGKISDIFSSDFADGLIGDSKYAHACRMPSPYNTATTSNVTPITKADRSMVLIKQFLPTRYVIIADAFQKNSSSNMYTWQAYIPATFTSMAGSGTIPDTKPYSYQLTYQMGGGVGLKMFFVTPSPLTKKLLPKYPDRDSASYPETRGDRAFQVTQAGVVKGEFLTFLIPFNNPNAMSPQVTVLNKSNPMVVSVVEGTRENIVVFNSNGGNVSYQNEYLSISTDGQLTVVSKNSGVVNGYLIQRGSFITVDGNSVFSNGSTTSTGSFSG